MENDSIFGHKVRTGERHEIRCEARIERLDEHQQLEPPESIIVCDIARSGVRLQSDKSLAKGSTWRLRLLDGSCVLASVPVIIRYCHEDGQSFRVGAQLIFDPSVFKHLGLLTSDGLDEADDGSFDIAFQVAFETP